MRLVVVYWQRSGYSHRVAEYKKPYRIAQRRVFDIDEEGRADGEVIVVPTDADDWSATIRYNVKDANLNFVAITLYATGDDITSTLWNKRFPIGEIRRYLRETFKEHPEWMSAGAMQGVEEQKRRAQEAVEVLRKNKPQRGPGRKNDEHWRSITDVYLWAVRTREDKSVYQRMADRFNEKEDLDYDEKTMKWKTERARDYGWLTRPGKGKIGGEHGPRYLEWKEQQK